MNVRDVMRFGSSAAKSTCPAENGAPLGTHRGSEAAFAAMRMLR